MDRLSPILRAHDKTPKVSDSGLDSDCSTASSFTGLHKQHTHKYKGFSAEEQWHQDSMDVPDVCSNTRCPIFIHGGEVPGSVFLSLSSSTSEQLRAGFSAQQPDDLDMQPVPKKHLRPCKGKRLRFRKLIDHLKDKVRRELEHFDVEDIPLPSCMANDPKTVARVKAMMSNYRDQVLAGVEVPDLDAKQFRLTAKQGPEVPLQFDDEVSL